MEGIKSSKILKIISYTLVPILTILILINISTLLFCYNSEEVGSEITSYYDTSAFVNRYLRAIRESIRSIKEVGITIYKQDGIVLEPTNIETSDITQYVMLTQYQGIGNQVEIQYRALGSTQYDILIVTKDGEIFTNIEKTVKTDTLEELKQYIANKQYKWIYENGQISTTMDKLKYDEIAYDGIFEEIKENDCDIYSCVKNPDTGRIHLYNLAYKVMSKTYSNAPITLVISSIMLLILIIYIVTSIGHKKGCDGIYTSEIDNIELGILAIIGIGSLIIEVCTLYAILGALDLNYTTQNIIIDSLILLVFVIGLIMYITIAICGASIIRRIKAKIFWKNTITYKLGKWIKSNTTDVIFNNSNKVSNLVVIYIGFLIVQIAFLYLFVTTSHLIFLIILLLFWYAVFKYLLDKQSELRKIRNKINEIYKGETGQDLDENKFEGEQKEVASELNDIAGGLSNALEEAMKSERLKTELITNVSHDIKTPLTSIINYVDLMKKENIKNEKVKEYLDVLDNKSQRLKKLTEDLVEASKASSGNIKFNMEKLNIKELIKQVGGEFEDKLLQRGLTMIENLPEEDIYIMADSRYMYRVMENMYVNISKYALENSRVYIDAIKEDEKVKVVLKNISQDKLNISVDELMQRFVRGDSSRTTEGSGLGISIAKSLTELQGGKLDIVLDGDLFKVIIQFDAI